MRFLFLLAFVCFAVLFSTLEAKKSKKEDGNVDKALFCDFCQTFAHYVHGEVKPGKNYKKNALTVRVNEVMGDGNSFCDKVKQKFGEVLDMPEEKFAPSCRAVYDRVEGDLEEMVAAGISEVALAKGACLHKEVCSALWTAEQHVSKRETKSMKNDRLGKEYLEANKQKEGVTVTSSGLQWEKLSAGAGDFPPSHTDRVKVHYKGTLIDGDEFDSSYSRGEPTTFGVNQVIPGWTEGLQLMVAGDKFRFVIPWNLAYGEGGSGAKIGPKSVLVFEVELLEIEASEKADEEASEADAEVEPLDDAALAHEEL